MQDRLEGAAALFFSLCGLGAQKGGRDARIWQKCRKLYLCWTNQEPGEPGIDLREYDGAECHLVEVMTGADASNEWRALA
jgi:hypothetical protein